MELVELIARAIVASEGEGHNDPPLYDDHDPVLQEAYRDQAAFVIETLGRFGYSILKT
jgi:fermentation-respiration switch protein FrsA (DUF1100 family)